MKGGTAKRCALCHDSADVTRVSTYDATPLLADELHDHVALSFIDLCDDCAAYLDKETT